jgi:membrane protein implicated in regulation of membrane protease activity
MQVVNFIIAIIALAVAIAAYYRTTRGEINTLKKQVDSLRESAAKALEKIENSIRPQ